LSAFSEPGLFPLYRAILRELKGRGVIRNENAPAGDYAEYLAGPRSAANWHQLGKAWEVLGSDGPKLQVKARVGSDPPADVSGVAVAEHGPGSVAELDRVSSGLVSSLPHLLLLGMPVGVPLPGGGHVVDDQRAVRSSPSHLPPWASAKMRLNRPQRRWRARTRLRRKEFAGMDLTDHAGVRLAHGRPKVNGVEIHYAIGGAGEPVFLLHGTPKTMSTPPRW
jgi:hypothetical protein